MSGKSPPAGGFGGAPPAGPGEIVQLSRPKPTKYLGGLAFALLVATVLGVWYYAGWGQYRLAMYSRGQGDLRTLEATVSETYRARGELCPSTSTLPTRDVALPAEVSDATLAADPGWSCLGWRPTEKSWSTRMRVERVGPERVILTSGNNFSRGHGPVHWAVRGVVNADAKSVEFEDIKEEPGP